MCLSRITTRFRPTKKVTVGYKLFYESKRDPVSHRREGYQFEYRSLNGSRAVPRGRWLKADKGKKICPGYRPGFHAMTTRHGGYNIGVLLRGVRTEGMQYLSPCIVADEMFVPTKSQRIVGNVVIDKTGQVVS